MSSSLGLRLAAGASSALFCACTAALDVDRYHTEIESKPVQTQDAVLDGNYYDLRFTASGMSTHLDEHFEIRLLDKNNQIVSKAVFDDITGEKFSLFLGKSVPKQAENRPYRIDFWADHDNKDRTKPIGYNEPPPGALIDGKDHAWRQLLREAAPPEGQLSSGRYDIAFQHNTNFTDLLTGADNVTKVPQDVSKRDCHVAFTLDPQFLGKMFEVRISSKDDGHLAGLWRRGHAMELTKVDILNILDEGGYVVSAFVDEDGSGAYEKGEPSWSSEFESTADGTQVVEVNTVTLPQTPIDIGAPE